MPFSPYVLTTLLLFASSTVADVTDWVNIDYVLKLSPSSSTSNARKAICDAALSSANRGPWSVTNTTVVPPSGDIHDYLSWAPYHWPNCNWCTGGSGRVHLVHDGNSTKNGSTSGDDDDSYEDEAIRNPNETSIFRRRMNRVRRRRADTLESPEAVAAVDVPGPQGPFGALPSVAPPSSPNLSTPATTTTATGVAGASAPPQAAAKCTPSPTKPMPASATWTTCPYEPRDGQVNPDVRSLNGPSAINSASQSIIYNCVCCGLQVQGSTASKCSRNAVDAIDKFFLNATTKLNPNMNFGQVVRGPGASGKQGTFTGILDLRGIVKIVNCLQILRKTGSPDWTDARDQAMGGWMGQYLSWLTDSDLGKSTASKANNHNTFYIAQVTAVKMSMGDQAGALQVLQYFFMHQYMDQIAANGEQPLEAVRTRPYHYRCFNLEALITLAKLGDQLGSNFWMTQSRYKANIQGAVDFVMSKDPKDEDGTEACPHVAAAAAAYGDPTGKYAAFLRRVCPGYQSQAFWFYDQPDALTNAPGAQSRHDRRIDTLVENSGGSRFIPRFIPFRCPVDPNPEEVPGLLSPPEDSVELDDGIWVSCNDLKPFYEVETGECS
ncbi:chondroitin AC/alginate lyase [Mycena galericulata]|nr:chondroitin AC/alginate lyase [Mycena galericulata]